MRFDDPIAAIDTVLGDRLHIGVARISGSRGQNLTEQRDLLVSAQEIDAVHGARLPPIGPAAKLAYVRDRRIEVERQDAETQALRGSEYPMQRLLKGRADVACWTSQTRTPCPTGTKRA